MKKRILSAILAALMLTAPLASCATGDGNTDEDNTNDSSAVTEEDTGVHDDLPEDLTFDGEIITIISRDRQGLTNGEISVEGLNGQSVNDAVFERNKAVESRLGITINSILDKDPTAETVPGKVATAVQAGTGEYDLMAGAAYVVVNQVLSGIFADLAPLTYLDLEKPYWAQGYNEAVSYRGMQFTATGAMLLATYRCAFVTVFNKALFTDANQPFLYDTVEKGEWTMDKQASLVPLFHQDNGNGRQDAEGDVYGFISSSYTGADPYWSCCKVDILQKNADGELELILDLGKIQETVEKMLYLYYNTEQGTYAIDHQSNDSEYDMVAGMFAQDQGAMATLHIAELESTTMRQMDSEYGVIPMPKFNKAQEDYYTMLHDQFTITAIPTTVKGERLEMMGAFLESMASNSYRIIRPAYYEETLRTQIAQDPQSAMMMDTIVEGIYIDAGILYLHVMGNFQNKLRGMLGDNLNNATSAFRAMSIQAERGLQKKLIDKLDALADE